MTAIITISIILAKAYIDHRRWPFENHWIGATVVGGILIALCWWSREIYPLFLYGLLFNPVLNVIRGLPFFHMGKTAWTDELLHLIFGNKAGQYWFFANLIALILTI